MRSDPNTTSVTSLLIEIHVTGQLITGSWDRTLRFWDPRAPTAQVASHATPERVYALDHVNNTLVVALASRLFHIYDVRKMDTPAQQRESSLKYMTRSLACMPDGEGASSSISQNCLGLRLPVQVMQPRPSRAASPLNTSTLHPPHKKKNTPSNAIGRPLTMSTTSGPSTPSPSTPYTTPSRPQDPMAPSPSGTIRSRSA